VIRWVVALVLAGGCAKNLDELYPFRCPLDGTPCPLVGEGVMCNLTIGCTHSCATSAQCTDADGNRRVDLACVPDSQTHPVCQQSCTDESGNADPSRCADSYSCVMNMSELGNAVYTCVITTTP
jgi:hypothetical protein